MHPQDTDIHALSGLPVTVEGAALSLHFGPGVSAPEPDRRSADDLRAVLLDPEAADGSDHLYTVYRDLTTEESARDVEQRGMLYVALVARAGRVGEEWVRTRGHINSHASGTPTPYPEVHEIWQGRALLYLQTEAAPDVTDTAVLAMEPGDKAVVPPGWASLLVNIGDAPLVVGTWRTRDCVPQYEALEALGGLAHYVLAGKEAGAYSFEPNANYRTVPVPRKVPVQDLPDFGLHRGEPMYTTFRRNPDFFRFMSRPQDYEHVWTTLYR